MNSASPTLTLAALLAGIAVTLVVHHLTNRQRRLVVRLEPFVIRTRTLLGLPADPALLADPSRPAPVGVLGRVFGPALADLADRLIRLLSGGRDDDLAQRLRHAGRSTETPAQWRLKTVGAGLLIATLVGMSGVVVGLGPVNIVALGLAALAMGIALGRGRLTTAVENRRARMRSELAVTSQLLAMRVRTGDGPLQAVQRIATTGTGPAASELAAVLAQITAGEADSHAFERLAMDTAEPAAARLYRLLATTAEQGGDLPRGLRALADDLRSQHREDLERSATRRRGLMVAATVLFLAPVMLIFVAAPIPRIVFGN